MDGGGLPGNREDVLHLLLVHRVVDHAGDHIDTRIGRRHRPAFVRDVHGQASRHGGRQDGPRRAVVGLLERAERKRRHGSGYPDRPGDRGRRLPLRVTRLRGGHDHFAETGVGHRRRTRRHPHLGRAGDPRKTHRQTGACRGIQRREVRRQLVRGQIEDDALRSLQNRKRARHTTLVVEVGHRSRDAVRADRYRLDAALVGDFDRQPGRLGGRRDAPDRSVVDLAQSVQIDSGIRLGDHERAGRRTLIQRIGDGGRHLIVSDGRRGVGQSVIVNRRREPVRGRRAHHHARGAVIDLVQVAQLDRGRLRIDREGVCHVKRRHPPRIARLRGNNLNPPCPREAERRAAAYDRGTGCHRVIHGKPAGGRGVQGKAAGRDLVSDRRERDRLRGLNGVREPIGAHGGAKVGRHNLDVTRDRVRCGAGDDHDLRGRLAHDLLHGNAREANLRHVRAVAEIGAVNHHFVSAEGQAHARRDAVRLEAIVFVGLGNRQLAVVVAAPNHDGTVLLEPHRVPGAATDFHESRVRSRDAALAIRVVAPARNRAIGP